MPFKKYIIILSLSLSGFAVLYISIMLKGIVTNILEQIDHTFYTQFLSVRERLKEGVDSIESNIVIVGIDDRTLNKLGTYNPQAYRRYHIDALANILKGKPAAVAYDIFFGELHDGPDVDEKLAQTMKQGPVFSIVFGTAQDRSEGIFEHMAYKMPSNAPMDFVTEHGLEQMSPPIQKALTGVGLANAYPDNDGLIRKMPVFFRIENKLFPTISFELFVHLMKISKDHIHMKKGKIYAGSHIVHVDNHCRAFVDIDKGYQIRELSFYDVCKGRLPARFFENKTVFIAATASGLGDNKLVPLQGYISGVLIHAYLLLNFLNSHLIREVSGSTYFSLVYLASLFYTHVYYSRKELSTMKRIMGYIWNVGLAAKATAMLLKISAINRMLQAFKSAYIRHYGLRLFFLLFSEARSRIEPILLHLVLLYIVLFLIFYFFHIFINPSALIIQLFIAYIIVSEFNRIDFNRISSGAESAGSNSD